jgi:transposase
MRKSRLSKKTQDKLMEHFVAGTTARCAPELIEINHNTAAYYYQGLRGTVKLT